MRRIVDLRLLAEDGFFKLDGLIVAQVAAALDARAGGGLPPPMLNISPKISPKMSPMSCALAKGLPSKPPAPSRRRGRSGHRRRASAGR